jgi:hypothetical protein
MPATCGADFSHAQALCNYLCMSDENLRVLESRLAEVDSMRTLRPLEPRPGLFDEASVTVGP